MLCLSGFELYSRWVPLSNWESIEQIAIVHDNSAENELILSWLALNFFDLSPLCEYFEFLKIC